jgi:hypothetical protein
MAAAFVVVGVWIYANSGDSADGAGTPVTITADAGASVTAPEDAPIAPGTGRVLLLTTPSGCLVSESGEPLGISPLDSELPAGSHRLAIECPEQALTGETTVVVEPGRTARSVVTLERDAGRPRAARHERDGHEASEPAVGAGPDGSPGTSTTEAPTTPDPGPTPEPTHRPDAGRGFTRPGILGGSRTH